MKKIQCSSSFMRGARLNGGRFSFGIMSFYNSKRWQEKRAHILRRDKWTDQIALADGIRIEADTVHHILPAEDFPEYRFADWNLIAVNNNLTHKKRLHLKYTGQLTNFGRRLMFATAQQNGVKLRMKTLIIGMPGTGKSTYAKEHLGGGLCYELDAIACAFRLTIPHNGEVHAGARRMAAALRRAWIQEATKYAENIFIVRTAPDVAELSETLPDKIVVCTKVFAERPYKYDKEDYKRQIQTVIDWADANGVPIEYNPPPVV